MSLTIGAHLSWAQSSDLITGDFENLNLMQFIEVIERQTDYKFFFIKGEVDSLIVNYSGTRKPITEVLNEILKDTPLKFSIDQDGYIYITTRNTIITELPSYYFSIYKHLDDSVITDNNLFEEGTKIKTDAVTVIGKKGSNTKATATVAGYVRQVKSGESIVGATIMIEKPLIGSVTDGNGYFSITLPKGNHELKISSLGMKGLQKKILLHSDGEFNIDMEEDVTPLKEIIVESSKDENVMGLQMGLERFDFKTMKQLPMALGEVDILKTVLILPGVQTVGEGTVGFNVRGGATDQNLILFNDATIFNPSHLFGFFSAFNPDIIKNVELYKSGVPAEYGGRISSVLDITTREGNRRKWSGAGGISPITGRFTIEGPLVKDKLSILLGGRSTYSDWLLNQIPSSALNQSKASFFDLNAHIGYSPNSRNTFTANAYISKDQFKLQSDTIYSYKNSVIGIKWNHIFNSKLIGSLSGNYSGYTYNIQSGANPINAFNLDYAINQLQAKIDLSYFYSSKHTLTSGAGVIKYDLSPGNYQPSGNQSIVLPDKLQSEQAIESFVYVGSQYELTSKLSTYFGIRYSMFQNFGPHDVYNYAEGVERNVDNIIDTTFFSKGANIATYSGPEYRASLRYSYSRKASFKVSFNRHRQYIQMLSNTTAIAPTDVWKLSDSYINPLVGDQISVGHYSFIGKRSIEISIEAYYKWMKNFLDYKGGAELIQNHHIETDVLNAKGNAYGFEFMLKRSTGKLNGWFSYTYSRSLLRTIGSTSVETINRGEWYPSNYDKPHALNFISNYKFSRRYSMSLNMVYSTGRPITLPIGVYNVDGTERLVYSDRNQYRIPDYFRTDLAINIEGNHKIKKLAHSYWSLSTYNLTGRRNAYSVFFTSENGIVKGYKLSIFGSVIPTLSYNFKF